MHTFGLRCVKLKIIKHDEVILKINMLSKDFIHVLSAKR